MNIIYTCPQCGGDLVAVQLTCNPPINRMECPKCGWSHEEDRDMSVVRIPYTEKKDNVVDLGGNWFISASDNTVYVPPGCRYCSNHPSNGGSGICHCVMGSQTLY